MTKQRPRVVAIAGSTRQNSTNHGLLNAIAELAAGRLDITFSVSIAHLPQFDPDQSSENTPGRVTAFRDQLDNADGVIICTPEYAHGVPGALKNAIDWTVSSSQFSNKPTVLITASTDGRYGHDALLETLRVIEAKNIDQLQLLIPFAKTKINSEQEITDEKTLNEVKLLIDDFVHTIAG